MDIHLLPKKRNKVLKSHDQYLLANQGVCTALLALDLDITERYVIRRQRKLGIRPFAGNPPRKGKGHAVNAKASVPGM